MDDADRADKKINDCVSDAIAAARRGLPQKIKTGLSKCLWREKEWSDSRR